MEAVVRTLVERVEELISTGDREPVWGNPLLSVTPIPISINDLALRTAGLEKAVMEIAREVQSLTSHESIA